MGSGGAEWRLPRYRRTRALGSGSFSNRCTMRVKEIEHGRWQRFFEDFSRLHHGRHVNVESTADGTARSCCSDKPLIGIVSADEAADSAGRIDVVAGDWPGGDAAYCVSDPRHVWVGEEENGATVGLQIDAADGTVTMLRFEPPVEGMPFGFKLV